MENGRYVLVDDAVEENGYFPDRPCRNNIGGPAVVRASLQLAVDPSQALELDADLRPRWREILAELSWYPVTAASARHRRPVGSALRSPMGRARKARHL